MWKVKSQSIPPLFISANTISWFLLTLFIIIDILYAKDIHQLSFENIIAISASYFGGLILSSIIGGTILAKKMLRKSSLIIWNLTGVLSCLLFYFFYSSTEIITTIVLCLLLSCSIGLGVPTSLSLFVKETKAENRGKIGAVVFFTIQILAALIYLALNSENIELQFLIIAIWRILGIAGIVFYKQEQKKLEERPTSLISIIKERKFILLFLPWFMFTLINYIETPVLEIGMKTIEPDLYNNYVLITTIITSIAAIPAGILCDLKGRKITGIAGFIFLGLGYAFLSLFSSAGIFAYILFMLFDGIAWGILYVNFIFVIWGDLSDGANREKYYVLGGLPFLLSGLIQVLVQPFAEFINIGLSFSLASFFLFIAVLPLVFAQESMSEKIIKDQELNTYIQKAMKTVKKVNKNDDTPKQENTNAENEANQESEKQEETPQEREARELAEKYY
jgi:MFS family permease